MRIISSSIKYLFIVAFTSLMGCNDKEIESLLPPDFENGVFITNEGNFGEGDGSLSYYDFDKDKAFNNIFSIVNQEKGLGDVVQSMHLGPDQIFVVVNNSKKVEVLGLDNLVIDYTISNLSLPRYMTSQGSKGYVSEWVSFTDLGRVSVVDLVTGSTLKTIETDYGAEGVIISENKLFVSNNFTNTVSVIDLDSESVVKSIEVGNAPGLIETDKDGDLWVVCAGGFDGEFNPLGDGKLVEIDPGSLTITKELNLGMNVSSKIGLSPSKDRIYYFSGTSLFSFNVNESSAPDAPLISNDEAVGFYGIGVDESGMIYLSDSKGFAESGEVLVYDPEGTLINHFEVGRGPNGFLFR